MISKYIRLCIWQIIVLAFSCPVWAQNLVPNPSFENYNSCPTGLSAISTNSYPTVDNWLNPLQYTSPDYFNTCATPASGVHVPEAVFGHQLARSGNAYAGIILWEERTNGSRFGEYLHTKLSIPMVAGRKYCVSFYVNPAITLAIPFNYMAVDEIGIHFSSSQISQATGNALLLPYHISNPSGSFLTDTSAWIKVSGIYTAAGGEEWLTLGRFDNTGTKPNFIQAYPPVANPALDYRAYVYIDDVSVYMITPADTFTSMQDSSYCDKNKMPMTLKSKGANGSFQWSTGQTTNTITVNTDGTYWCRAVAGCAVYIDTFIVKYESATKLDLGKELVNCNNGSVTILPNMTYGIFNWSTGANTPAITVNQPGTYWLKLTNACGVFTDTVRVYIQSPTPPPVVKDTTLCQTGESPILKNVQGQNIYWYTHPQSNIGSPIQPNIYTKETGRTLLYVTQKIGKCESEKVPMNIEIKYQPKKELDAKSDMCAYSPTFIGKDYPGVKYLWNNGSTACCIKPAREGLFKVSVSNECGEYIDSTRVIFSACDECIFVPNAFTPNGDGMNDKFAVLQVCPIANFHIRIFNRWGQQVFESKNIQQQWTGTETGLYADRGTYVYIIEYTAESNNVPRLLKGNISLLR